MKENIESNEFTVSDQVYDDVIRTQVERHRGFLIPLINKVFHTTYSKNATVELLSDVHHDAISDKMQLKVTDAFFKISENGISKVYHLECQSNGDASMIVRIMEYDFMIAIDQLSNDICSGCYESDLTLPQTTVLYLRHPKEMPDEFKVNIHYDGQVLKYKAPIVKVQTISLKEIIEDELFFLFPFYLMRYEEDIKKTPKLLEGNEITEENFSQWKENVQKIESVEKAINEVRESLRVCRESGHLTVYQEEELLNYTKRVFLKIVEHSMNKTRLVNYMSGELIETESHKAYTEGISQGKMIGFQEGEQSGFQKGEQSGIPKGENKKLISQIRGLEYEDIESATKFLKVDEACILDILNLITQHPEMNDEEIAELL